MNELITKDLNITEFVNNMISEFRENYIVAIMGVVIVIIILVLIYFFFNLYSLQWYNCKASSAKYPIVNANVLSYNSVGFDMFGAPNDTSALRGIPYYKCLALRDYYVQSAFNAACGGGYKHNVVSKCVIKDLIKQGVRGLDFEIYSVADEPVVAASTSQKYFVKEMYNYIPLKDVLGIIVNYAFANNAAPNPNDPILLHLRFRTTNHKVYQKIGEMIKQEYIKYDPNLGDDPSTWLGSNMVGCKFLPPKYMATKANMYGKMMKFFSSKKMFYPNGQLIQDTTTGKGILGSPIWLFYKKIIVMAYDPEGFSNVIPEFGMWVNVVTGSSSARMLTMDKINNAPSLKELQNFNRTNYTVAIPNREYDPKNLSASALRESGIQMICMRYMKMNNLRLEEYLDYFNRNGSSFVAKPERLRFVQRYVDKPKRQDPKLSFAPKTVKTPLTKVTI